MSVVGIFVGFGAFKEKRTVRIISEGAHKTVFNWKLSQFSNALLIKIKNSMESQSNKCDILTFQSLQGEFANATAYFV